MEGGTFFGSFIENKLPGVSSPAIRKKKDGVMTFLDLPPRWFATVKKNGVETRFEGVYTGDVFNALLAAGASETAEEFVETMLVDAAADE